MPRTFRRDAEEVSVHAADTRVLPEYLILMISTNYTYCVGFNIADQL